MKILARYLRKNEIRIKFPTKSEYTLMSEPPAVFGNTFFPKYVNTTYILFLLHPCTVKEKHTLLIDLYLFISHSFCP